jgi:hypothetical protein
MRVRIYGAIVARPISFPEDLEIRVFPLRRDDGASFGGSYPMDEHHPWDWVRNQYPVTAEADPRIRADESVSVMRTMTATTSHCSRGLRQFVSRCVRHHAARITSVEHNTNNGEIFQFVGPGTAPTTCLHRKYDCRNGQCAPANDG